MARPKSENSTTKAKNKMVSIPSDLWNQVKNEAEKTDRSVAWTVKSLVQKGLDKK